MIKIENLKKEYVSGDLVTKVLHGVSFNVDFGEFVSIMGPSGSGKSTLMHILGLLDRLSSGIYELDGKSVASLDDDQLANLRNEKIGFVFQAFNLLPKTTVLENVMLPLTYSNNKNNMRERAAKVLESVGLGHRLNYYTNQISGGEKQRVAIARALVNKPSVIFADEPTGNLDSKSGAQVMEILQKLNDAGNTIILVTHETATAEHAKRIIKIRDGIIVSDEQVLKRRFIENGILVK
ncbi:MAG: ABC transporter ATP-binding protein [Patescibacteria group bacterium]|nr:ABC transporter ATP-binding protein [Patescibacteria group bacterium]